MPISIRTHSRSPPHNSDHHINHRRAHVVASKELLYRADVVSPLEKVRGERVSQAMRARGFCDPGQPGGLFDRALDHGLVEMMAPTLPGLPMEIEAGCREDPLPAPLLRRLRVLPCQCIGQLHVTRPSPEIQHVLLPRPRELLHQRLDEFGRYDGNSIFTALTVSNGDLVAAKVDIRHLGHAGAHI
jgi:hypothetical protein